MVGFYSLQFFWANGISSCVLFERVGSVHSMELVDSSVTEVFFPSCPARFSIFKSFLLLRRVSFTLNRPKVLLCTNQPTREQPKLIINQFQSSTNNCVVLEGARHHGSKVFLELSGCQTLNPFGNYLNSLNSTCKILKLNLELIELGLLNKINWVSLF